MGALFLFVLFSVTVIPLLTLVYVERITILEEVRALTVLEKSVHEIVVDGFHSMESVNQFEIKSKILTNRVVKTCITWTGTNGREYEYCLLAAK